MAGGILSRWQPIVNSPVKVNAFQSTTSFWDIEAASLSTRYSFDGAFLYFNISANISAIDWSPIRYTYTAAFLHVDEGAQLASEDLP